MRLWKKFGKEPFLVNPRLFIGNPKRKRSKTMAKKGRRLPPRNKKGRFVKKGYAKRARAARTVAKSRVARRVYRAKRASYKKARRGVVLLNPRRRRRSYRRNPNFGRLLSMNTAKTAGFTILGMAGTPFVEGMINQYLPASITGNMVGKYGVKIAAGVGIGFAADKIFGREAAKAVYIGAAVYVGMGLIRDFAPNLLPGSTGRYVGAGRYMGKQPFLGSYMTQSTPARLQPESRF